MMKVLVVGAGALGSLLGGRMIQAGNPVIFYDTNKDIVNHLTNHGLIIEEMDGMKSEIKPVMACNNPGDMDFQPDLVLITVKSYSTEKAISDLINVPGLTRALFLSLQNGLGNVEIIASRVGYERLLAGTTSQGATLVSPGVVRHGGAGPTFIGALGSKVPDGAEGVVDMLNSSGIEAYYKPDVETLIWEKLLVNVGINALTAVAGILNGDIVSIEPAREICCEAVREALEVAKARGLSLPEDFHKQVLAVAEATGRNKSSMRQDIELNRPTEIDYINGAIVKLGRELGISTPVNWTLTQLIKTKELSRNG